MNLDAATIEQAHADAAWACHDAPDAGPFTGYDPDANYEDDGTF